LPLTPAGSAPELLATFRSKPAETDALRALGALELPEGFSHKVWEDTQSTHRTEVTESIQQTVIQLREHFKGEPFNNDFSDQNTIETAYDEMGEYLKAPETLATIMRLKQLEEGAAQAYLNTARQSYNRAKTLDEALDEPFTRSMPEKHPSSTECEALALTWWAIHDLASPYAGDAPYASDDLPERQLRLIDHLHQVATEYGENSQTCNVGMFNQIITTNNKAHRLVDIKMVDILDAQTASIVDLENFETIVPHLGKLIFEAAPPHIQGYLLHDWPAVLNRLASTTEDETPNHEPLLQWVRGTAKRLFKENFKTFYPNVEYDAPTSSDYRVLEAGIKRQALVPNPYSELVKVLGLISAHHQSDVKAMAPYLIRQALVSAYLPALKAYCVYCKDQLPPGIDNMPELMKTQVTTAHQNQWQRKIDPVIVALTAIAAPLSNADTEIAFEQLEENDLRLATRLQSAIARIKKGEISASFWDNFNENHLQNHSDHSSLIGQLLDVLEQGMTQQKIVFKVPVPHDAINQAILGKKQRRAIRNTLLAGIPLSLIATGIAAFLMAFLGVQIAAALSVAASAAILSTAVFVGLAAITGFIALGVSASIKDDTPTVQTDDTPKSHPLTDPENKASSILEQQKLQPGSPPGQKKGSVTSTPKSSGKKRG